MKRKRQRILALAQGLYYLVTGLWPMIDMNSFVAITGPKESLWLVNTVGILLLVTALVLLTAAFRKQVGLEGFLLAVGDAVALAIIEIFYVFRGQIQPVYMVDAIIQIGLAVAWIASLGIREPAVVEVPPSEPPPGQSHQIG